MTGIFFITMWPIVVSHKRRHTGLTAFHTEEPMKGINCSVLRQVLNGSGESEVTREELRRPGQHQLVALSDGDVGDARHVCDLSLCPLVVAGLAGHVDRCRRHGDRRPSRYNVKVGSLFGNLCGSLLNFPGLHFYAHVP